MYSNSMRFTELSKNYQDTVLVLLGCHYKISQICKQQKSISTAWSGGALFRSHTSYWIDLLDVVFRRFHFSTVSFAARKAFASEEGHAIQKKCFVLRCQVEDANSVSDSPHSLQKQKAFGFQASLTQAYINMIQLSKQVLG